MNERPSAAQDLEVVKRVLLVDDDQQIRQVLRLVLESEGYEVAAAADGIAAIEFLTRAKDTWIVLLDVMMPGLSGLEVCAHLHAAGPTAARHRVALMTACGLDTEECPLPARTLLRKPFNMGTIRDVVAALAHDDAEGGSELSNPTNHSQAADKSATT
jgi:CheY-like chemotaxis protein